MIDIHSKIRPVNGAPFPVVEDTHVEGGYHTVSDITNRNLIPVANRKDGMKVFVKDDGSGLPKEYTLFLGYVDLVLSNNANWVESSTLMTTKHINVVKPTEILNVQDSEDLIYGNDLYNKGTININAGTGNQAFGLGNPVPTYGVLRVDGMLVNEGLIINQGLLLV
jgi:hypothetical protein